MTELHITTNSDRVHFVENGMPFFTFLFSEFNSKDDAIAHAKRELWARAEYLERRGEKLKVSFIPKIK